MQKRTILAALGALALGATLYKALRARSRYSLDGRVVLISGGSRGLGLVLAREVTRRGARVVLLARSADELERARIDLALHGANDVLIIPCDVTDSIEVRQSVAQAVNACGRVDVLFNVVGEIEVGPVESMRMDDFEKALDTNFWGPFRLMREVIPAMRSRGGGRIANVSSIGGLVAVPHLLPYVASKFALTGLSLGLRSELAKDGIVVSTLCPGLMRTGSPKNATFKGDRAAEFAWFAVSDSLPLLSVGAESAARRMVQAVEYGEARVVVGLHAKVAAWLQAASPGLVSALLSLADRILPGGSDASPATRGEESRGADLPSALVALSDRAAARNNEN